MKNNEENATLKQYGFVEKEGGYWFARTGKYGSNFVIKPLVHPTETEPYLVCSIKNIHGYECEIKFEQKDFISMKSFMRKIESYGNFVWIDDEIAFIQLKSYIYDLKEKGGAQ